MPPVATVSNYALIITTSSLPDATLGVPYSATLTASGGLPPYTWSVISGALPPGLSLDSAGNITGTPTTMGTYFATFQVVDPIGNVGTISVGVLI
jgi:hypothetical protein